MLVSINQMAFLHLHMHARPDLCRALRSSVEMQDARFGRENAAPARFTDTSAPISLLGIHKKRLIKHPDPINYRARHQHEHARYDIDISCRPTIPILVPRPPKTWQPFCQMHQPRSDYEQVGGI